MEIWASRVIAVVGILTLAGCGGSDTPEMVAGQVFYQERPLAGGSIVFAPDSKHGQDGALAFAEIGRDGRYTVRDGLASGWYRVTFASAQAAALPARFGDPERGGQSCEVKPGKANIIDFHLK